MTDIPTITQEEAVEVRARELLAVEHDNAGFTVSGAVIRDARAHRLNDLSEGNKLAIRAIAKALSPNMDHAVGGVSDWQPRIGEQVEVTEDVDDWRSWRESKLFVAGVQAHRMGLPGLEITVSEDWPRTSHSNGLTDDFWISRPFKPDMLKPVHRRESAPPVNQVAVREALGSVAASLDVLFSRDGKAQHYAYVQAKWVKHIRATIAAALATPPLDNTGLDAATVEPVRSTILEAAEALTREDWQIATTCGDMIDRLPCARCGAKSIKLCRSGLSIDKIDAARDFVNGYGWAAARKRALASGDRP